MVMLCATVPVEEFRRENSPSAAEGWNLATPSAEPGKRDSLLESSGAVNHAGRHLII